jgi:ribose/xylose/arabinose/galactoside ABC-type transport system permease subunit
LKNALPVFLVALAVVALATVAALIGGYVVAGILIGTIIISLLMYFALTFKAHPIDAKKSDPINVEGTAKQSNGAGATVMIALAVISAIIAVMFVVAFFYVINNLPH